jgi:hypothetical protein
MRVNVQELVRLFKWMGYVALGIAILIAAGLVTLAFALEHWLR